MQTMMPLNFRRAGVPGDRLARFARHADLPVSLTPEQQKQLIDAGVAAAQKAIDDAMRAKDRAPPPPPSMGTTQIVLVVAVIGALAWAIFQK